MANIPHVTSDGNRWTRRKNGDRYDITYLVLLLPVITLLFKTGDLSLEVFRLDINLSQPVDTDITRQMR